MPRSRAQKFEFFRQLLIDYLTDPEYAEVKKLKDGRLSVKLPDGGGRFYVAITAPTD